MAAGSTDQSFPQLFFSYAHAHWEDLTEQQDADLWIRKFYGNLCTEIELLVDLPRGQDPIFIDRRITLGANWPQVLSEKLSQCAVFVPLYTRNYFQHPDCGREWSVIRQRQDMHIAATKSYPDIIVPVLWDPVRPQDLPPWARDIQYAHEELGYAYRTYGLEELIRVKDHEAEYQRAVRFLARRIVEVANATDKLRSLREIPVFRSLPNEFANLTQDGESGKVRITVVALDTSSPMPPGRSKRWYGSTAQEWTPYLDPQDGPGHDTPVAWRASDVAGQRDFVTEVTELTSRSEELKVNGIPTAPTILLVDPWATLDPAHWTLLDRLDKITQHKPWIRIILPWNSRDPETIANANVLHAGIETHLGHTRSQGRIPSRRRGEPGPIDSSALGLEVSEALRAALMEFLRQSKKYLPAGARSAKPRLRGPIGMGAPLGHDDNEDPAAPREDKS